MYKNLNAKSKQYIGQGQLFTQFFQNEDDEIKNLTRTFLKAFKKTSRSLFALSC